MQRGGLDPRQVPLQGYEARCDKILKDLEAMPGATFVSNDAQFAGILDYKKIIKEPRSIEYVRNHVFGTKSGGGGALKYTYLNDFALDVRRICGNFLRFNYYADSVKLRKDMTRILLKFEQWWYELHQEIDATQPGMFFTQPLPELRWCLQAYDDAIKVKLPPIVSGGEPVYPIGAFIYAMDYCFPNPKDYKEYKSVV